MANSLSKKKPSPEPANIATPSIKTRTVTFNQSVSIESFNALSRVKKAKGFLTEQEVVRLAIAFFLEKNSI